jgi:hypothetical protein
MEKLPPPFPFHLIRRRGQKKIRIRIDRSGQVVVSAPLFMNDRTLMEALAGKKSWVDRHLLSHRVILEEQEPLNRLAWQGLIYQVRQTPPGKTKKPSLGFDEKSLICTFVISDEDRENARDILADQLKKRARPVLAARLEENSRKHRISYRQFQLRDQKTLWGSSSGRGCISLNWRIALLPERLQTYLICHELCHQKVMNHSPAFWHELEEILPGSRQANRELKEWRYLMDLFR